METTLPNDELLKKFITEFLPISNDYRKNNHNQFHYIHTIIAKIFLKHTNITITPLQLAAQFSKHSLQQIAGGIAAAVGGMIVVQKTKTSPLEHYDTLGIVISVILILAVLMVYRVSVLIKKQK